MLLDYGTQLSPEPISLSIGTLLKPKLKDIAKITFSRFIMYEFFLKCTPKEFYTKALRENGGIEAWNSLAEETKESMTMYSLIAADEQLQELYTELFGFFFAEKILYKEGFFILFKDDFEPTNGEIPTEMICGVISEKNFAQVADLIQQICCIHSKADEDMSNMKFKNDLARKLYEKMQKAKKEQEKRDAEKADKDLSIPNIISSVAAIHPSYNLTNIWDLTIFQLFDAFRRMQSNTAYDVERVRVSVWGDEKKHFDPTLWHKNYFDT